jgi:phage I-like protein
LRKDCKDGKTTTSQSGGFYSGCGVKGHNKAKYWKFHPELKPMGSKGTKTGGNEKDKETKAPTSEKKGWKAKFAELEAKMAAMSATTTSGGAKHHVTPSYVEGRFGPDNEEYGEFMMSGMAFTAEDLTLEIFANTRSQTAAPKNTP